MSSGKDHARASKILAPVASFGIGAFVNWASGNLTWAALAATGGFVGCLAGIVLLPDLDQEIITTGEWTAMRWLKRFGIFGNLLGKLWVSYWVPYSIIPHRSVLSHGILIGTIGRVAYLFWLPIGLAIKNKVVFPVEFYIVAMSAFVGLVISDIAHLIMDNWSTSRKHKVGAR